MKEECKKQQKKNKVKKYADKSENILMIPFYEKKNRVKKYTHKSHTHKHHRDPF